MKKISQNELDILINEHNQYINSVMEKNERGKKLILDEIDFSGNDLSKLNFLEVYITSSLFKDCNFEGTNFGGAELYDCMFENIKFNKVNFGKAVLDYVRFYNVEFLDSRLIVLNTYKAIFKDTSINQSIINDAFSNCSLENIIFNNCTIESPEFWRCIIKNIKFSSKELIEADNLIKELNIGTFEKEQIISGDEAINYFHQNSKCIVDTDS